MSIWQVNTAENYEYIDADEVHVDETEPSSGDLYATKNSEVIAIWVAGFWLSVKNVEAEVNEDGEHPEVLTVPK